MSIVGKKKMLPPPSKGKKPPTKLDDDKNNEEVMMIEDDDDATTKKPAGSIKVVSLSLTKELRDVSESILSLAAAASSSSSSATSASSSAQKSCPIITSASHIIRSALDDASAVTTTTTTTKKKKNVDAISLSVVSSMRDILLELLPQTSTSEKEEDEEVTAAVLHRLKKELEMALRKSSLVYVYRLPPDTRTEEEKQEAQKEAMKFQRRMDKLRLKSEERKYSKFTSNIHTHRGEDDITTKSMTYAASIGLNMIVAPISFGTFVYFFLGHLWFRDGDVDTLVAADDRAGVRKMMASNTKMHIQRTMLAVMAGVAMLFIEMLLFVIRSHEFDSHVTRKKRRDDDIRGPFGRKKW